jgi:hypothetical protein
MASTPDILAKSPNSDVALANGSSQESSCPASVAKAFAASSSLLAILRSSAAFDFSSETVATLQHNYGKQVYQGQQLRSLFLCFRRSTISVNFRLVLIRASLQPMRDILIDEKSLARFRLTHGQA